MSKRVAEICAQSAADCLAAKEAGADRIELNSALEAGGLTCFETVLKEAKALVDLPIACMVRSRAGGFVYDDQEKKTMLKQAESLMDSGADAIVFGALNPDGTLDEEFTEKMIRFVHGQGKEAVFHRAIDVCTNAEEALLKLSKLGADRILTSGQAPTAPEGTDVLKKWNDILKDTDLILVAGSGMNADNAADLMKKTGISQVHGSCSVPVKDQGAKLGSVSFETAADGTRKICSKEKAAAFSQAIHNC